MVSCKYPTSDDGLSAFVLDAHQTIPDSARHFAAILLIDTLAVAFGAAKLEVAHIARDFAVDFMAASDAGQSARILCDDRRASQIGAAYAAATMIDNLDAHDGYNPVKGHIGCAVVPALFAMAEQLPDLTGRQALDAMVVAYEVAARAGLSLHASVSDYHTSGAWNALGVAALGCRLRGMSRDQLINALGIAEYHGPRSQMMREIDHPSMLHDGSGMGAQIGLSACLMAERGFAGGFALTVHDPAVGHFWQDLGRKWAILDNYIKPYPICRWAHAAIDAARLLRLDHTISPDQIARIEIRTFAEASRLFNDPPTTVTEAQYSLAYGVALMLVQGQVGPADVMMTRAIDPMVSALIGKVHVIQSDHHNACFPVHRQSDVAVTLVNGQTHESGTIHARGGTETPLTTDDVRAKFMQYTASSLSPAQATRLWDSAMELPESDAPLRELADQLHGAFA